MRIKVAGHSEPFLIFDPGRWQCGTIIDGVSLEHGTQGGWVIAFRDLEKMYLRAKEARKKAKEAP